MPSIIDSLIVTFGLDSSGVKTGAAEVRAEVRRTRDDTNSAAKQINASGQEAANFFRRIRNEAIAMFAVFLGAHGLKEFVRSSNEISAATGRLAKNIGVSTETLSAWQGAAQRAGGSAEGIGGTMMGLSQQFQQFVLTGNSAVIPYFRALGVRIADSNGKMRPMADIMLDLADSFKTMTPERANFFGRALGMDQGTINLLMQGRVAVEALLAQQAKLGVVTEADAKAAIAMNNAFLDLKQTITEVARSILTSVSPSITQLIKDMEAWITANKEWLKDEVVRRLEDFVKWLRAIDWTALKDGALKFGDQVGKVVDAFGGVVRIVEVLFGLWLGSKFLAVMAGIGMMTTALIPFMKAAAVMGILAGAGALTGEAAGDIEGAGTRIYNALRGKPETADETAARLQKRMDNDLIGRGVGAVRRWWRGDTPAQRTPTGATGGGGGATLGQMGDTTMGPEQTAFLNTLAEPESGGDYGRFNGRERTDDFSRHPNRVGAGGTSTAFGKYQFIHSTWQEQAAALGLTDISPRSQDQAAWNLSKTEYQKNTGRDLLADLRSGGHEERIAGALRGRWPSLPGGSQSNQAMSTFRQNYARNLERQALPLPPPPPPPMLGADVLPNNNAPVGTPTGVNSTTNSSSIGNITIHTQATDAKGIQRGLSDTLARYNMVPQANYGLA